MQEEAREARLARSAADDIRAGLSGDDRAQNTRRVRAGFAAIQRGDYTNYIGRERLARLSAEVKARGRKHSPVPRLSKPEKSVEGQEDVSERTLRAVVARGLASFCKIQPTCARPARVSPAARPGLVPPVIPSHL